jgi:hypothetical protein
MRLTGMGRRSITCPRRSSRAATLLDRYERITEKYDRGLGGGIVEHG